MLNLNVKRGQYLVFDVEGVHTIRVRFERGGANRTRVVIDAPDEVRITRESLEAIDARRRPE